MRFFRKSRFIFATLLFALTANPAISFSQQKDHVPGDLLVMLKKGIDINGLTRAFSSLEGKPTQLAVERNLSPYLNIWLLHFDDVAIEENKMLSSLKLSDQVIAAQFNHYLELRNTPDDALFSQQWNMLNTGQSGQTMGADIDASSAWDLTTGGLTAGGDTIVIAIVDQGFDLNHEDIHYHKNYHEIPGNGIDDDENGYIDDYDGWNSLDNNGNIPSDYHGTHVTGIAGARGNNSVGVAGVNWNVQILPVKGYSGVESIVVAGYSYVLDMRRKYNETNGADGALIVSANSSFGINNGQPGNFPLWCAMYDSMGVYGILHATATANSTVNVDVVGDMPTACPSDYMISVTNTTATDQKNPTAGYGDTTIDLGAPGTNIVSALPDNTYGAKTGTSSASPHVAGAVALIYSLPCEGLVADFRTDPAGAALRIKNFIMEGVDSLDDLTNNFPTVSGGRLNVYNSLMLAAAYYNCNVGISEVDNSPHNIFVYPNPAGDWLYVSVKNLPLAGSTLSVRNMLGQILISEKLSSSVKAAAIDVSELNAGVYLLAVDSGNPAAVIRFVKE